MLKGLIRAQFHCSAYCKQRFNVYGRREFHAYMYIKRISRVSRVVLLVRVCTIHYKAVLAYTAC